MPRISVIPVHLRPDWRITFGSASGAGLIALLLWTGCGRSMGAHRNGRVVFANRQAATLAAAIAADDAQKVRDLVHSGAALNSSGKDSITLLQWALLQRKSAMLSELLDLGADPRQPGLGGRTVVHMAAMVNDTTYLKILLAHGADPNVPNGVTQKPPLSDALLNPDLSAFWMLLAHHADPNRADRMGDTPLHVAAQIHCTQCVLALLDAGADATKRNNVGKTFQPYFNILPAGGLSRDGKAQWDAVHDWLKQHSIPIEDNQHKG